MSHLWKMLNIYEKLDLIARWYWNATLYFYLVLTVLQSQTSFCLSTNNSRLILRKFLTRYKTTSLVAFGCWHSTDELSLMKYMAERQIFIKLFHLTDKDISLHSLYTEYKPMAVVLNMQCQGADEVLKKASQKDFFRQLHYWLLLDAEYTAIKETNFKKSLSVLNIALDSQIFIVYQGSKIIIQSTYRIKTKEPLITPPYEWDAGTPFPFLPPRNDLEGITLRAGVVVVDDPWEHFVDLRYRHLNTMSKLSFVLTGYLAEMLNFRMKLLFTDAWGFPIDNTTVYSGIVGLLQNDSIDIGGTALIIKPARLDYVDYAAEAFRFVGVMMFLKPSLSEISVLYLLPFSNSVWATIVTVIAILTIALLCSSHWEHKVTDLASLSCGEAVINTIGIVCQQGSPRHPVTISSRIIYLLLLLLSLFLVASYSAIIVSLLQTSSSAINTLTELLDSSFQMSMKNISYSVNYVNDTNDPAVKRLYYEKLYTQPYDKAFTSQEVGVANVRKGFHAFQGDADVYKVISDTFEEHEKCIYAEITVFVTNLLGFPVQNHSPLKEFIARKARWLRETGFIDREYKRWYNQKPKCNNNFKSFVSVRIQDFYPALLVLAYGLIASFCILCIELLCYGIRKNRQGHIKPISKSLKKQQGTYLPQNIKVVWYN